MKILLCLNRDIYCCYALNHLLKNLDTTQIKIYFSDETYTKTFAGGLQELKRIEQDTSLENISHLFVEAKITDFAAKDFLNFEQIIEAYQLPILNFKNINQDGFEHLNKHWKPDLIISIRFRQIFKEPIIALPGLRIINLHSGILPDYRGVMASFWAMLNGEKELGCTLHFIDDSSIDTGNIIRISKLKTDYDKSLIANILRLYKDGTRMIIENVNQFKNNLVVDGVPQNKTSGRYFSCPNDDDVKRSGLRLF